MKDSNKKIKIAVIYFCYNRVDHLKRSLPKIIEFKNELPLFVFCDGPKNHNQTKTSEVIDYIKQSTKDIENCKIILRENNLGLAKNVISGVNEIFNLGFDSVTHISLFKNKSL